MITYQSGGAFGCNILFRLHGSAVFKSCVPAILSSIIYVLLYEWTDITEVALLDHPYPLAALITAFSFLLIFRANFSYNRYWEAHTAIHAMHSKWLDVATEVAAFHLQAACYQKVQPPSFGQHAEELFEAELLDPTSRFFWVETNSNTTDHVVNSGVGSEGGRVSTSTPTHSRPRQQHDPMTPSELEHQIDVQIEYDEQTHPSLRSRFQKTASLKNIKEKGKNRFQRFLRRSRGKRQLVDKEKSNPILKTKDKDKSENDDGGLQETTTTSRTSEDKKEKIDYFVPDDDDDDDKIHSTRDPMNNKVHRPRNASAPISNNTTTTTFTTNPHPKARPQASSLRSSTRNRHQSYSPHHHSTSRTVHFGSTPMPGGPRNVIPLVATHEKGQQQQQQQHDKSHKKKGDGSKKEKRTFRRQRQRHASDFFYPNDNKPYSSFWRHARNRLEEGHMNPKDVPVPYFLETVGHILSLLSAVALSTLRNDLAEAESPLAEFRPNAPWPHVDPDMYQGDIRKGWYQSEHRSYMILRYLLGLSRTDNARIRYNAGRPFRVIGNVSDEEIQALQTARGPQAKVTLVAFWLQELISREYLAGSTGNVAAPIISRIYQFVSDGMAGYNQARKVAYIPFPFPHAQITTLFVLVIVGSIPVLMLSYLENEFFGFFWNWLTVMCFTGLHEVARELENPFQNVPNDIPLNHFQAQFNEGLMVMFYGYHPDAYWLIAEDDEEENEVNKEEEKMEEPDSKQNVPTEETSTPSVTTCSGSAQTSTNEKDPASSTTASRKSLDRYETPLQMTSMEYRSFVTGDDGHQLEPTTTTTGSVGGEEDSEASFSDGSAIVAPGYYYDEDEPASLSPGVTLPPAFCGTSGANNTDDDDDDDDDEQENPSGEQTSQTSSAVKMLKVAGPGLVYDDEVNAGEMIEDAIISA